MIAMITKPISESPGVELLDVDMGYDFNRTVVTMVGDPEAVLPVSYTHLRAHETDS